MSYGRRGMVVFPVPGFGGRLLQAPGSGQEPEAVCSLYYRLARLLLGGEREREGTVPMLMEGWRWNMQSHECWSTERWSKEGQNPAAGDYSSAAYFYCRNLHHMYLTILPATCGRFIYSNCTSRTSEIFTHLDA